MVHPRRVANDFAARHSVRFFQLSVSSTIRISLQHDRVSNYDRTFHLKTGYCSKLHRDDRVHARGLNVNAEVSKSVGHSQSSVLTWERREEKREKKNKNKIRGTTIMAVAGYSV